MVQMKTISKNYKNKDHEYERDRRRKQMQKELVCAQFHRIPFE